MRRGLTLLAVLVAVPLLAGPAAAVEPPGPPVEVSALVRGADGDVTVRRGVAPGRARAEALARRWRGEAGVVAADVSQPVRLLADPLRPQQWGLDAVRAPEAWAGGDATGQVVAVIDTGVDLDHPDLAASLLPGKDWVDGDLSPQDANGHGTHVAGIIAAAPDNGIGGVGAAPGARVLPLRVLDAQGTGRSSDTAAAVLYAVERGATVINLSLGGPDRDSVLDAAVRTALDAGVTVVAAAGNEGAGTTTDPVNYPAALPGVVAVGAVDRALQPADFSNTGPYVALAAPGVAVVSTVLDGYGTMSGTSMATPFVAAAAALARAVAPAVRGPVVRQLLMSTAQDVGPVGVDDATGAGVVDAAAAVAAARALPPPAEPTTAPTPTAAPAAPAPAAVPDPLPAPLPTTAPVPTPEPTAGPALAPVLRDLSLACPVDRLPAPGFTDVDPGGVHARGIACVVWWGVAGGTSASTFAPWEPVSRGQLATFLVRALERSGVRAPADVGDPFADDDGSVHEDAIARLAALGVVQGVAPGEYAPGRPVSRAQLATFLVRAAELRRGAALPLAAALPPDVVGGPHLSSISKAVQAGFAQGTADGSYQPTLPVARGQLATFVARLLDALVAEGLATPPG